MHNLLSLLFSRNVTFPWQCMRLSFSWVTHSNLGWRHLSYFKVSRNSINISGRMLWYCLEIIDYHVLTYEQAGSDSKDSHLFSWTSDSSSNVLRCSMIFAPCENRKVFKIFYDCEIVNTFRYVVSKSITSAYFYLFLIYLTIHPSIRLYSLLLCLGRFFNFLIFTVGKTSSTGDQPVPSQGRYLHAGQQKQNKRTRTSMPQVGFEPTIPVFKWAKMVHVLDGAATVTDVCS
jgi:hypothetical protein